MPIVHEPGTIRSVNYLGARDADGRYPTTYWGSVDEQIAEVTALSLRDSSSDGHVDEQLYTWASDCEHLDPEEDDKYDGIDDLVDSWLLRNCRIEPGWPSFPSGGSRSPEYADYEVKRDLRYRQARRAEVAIPLVAEYQRVKSQYDDDHGSVVCYASPMGTACKGCYAAHDVDPDYGIEPFACDRQLRARERRDSFWWLFSHEGAEHRARQAA